MRNTFENNKISIFKKKVKNRFVIDGILKNLNKVNAKDWEKYSNVKC